MSVSRGKEEGEDLPVIEKEDFILWTLPSLVSFQCSPGLLKHHSSGKLVLTFASEFSTSWEATSQVCLFSSTDQEGKRRARRSWAGRSKGGPALCPTLPMAVSTVPLIWLTGKCQKTPTQTKPTQKPHGDAKNKIHAQKTPNQPTKHRNLCHLQSGGKLYKKGSPRQCVCMCVQWKLGIN